MNELLEAALSYAAEGFRVFPLHGVTEPALTCDCGDAHQGDKEQTIGKHPLTRNGSKDATTDADQIREWWTLHPNANIGVTCGRESGIFIVDVDVKRSDGKTGADSLQALIVEHGGAWPDTRALQTGSGGAQFLFKFPPVDEKLNRNGVRWAIDVRGENYYGILPPSKHRAGKAYTWVDRAAPIADAPTWLVDVILEKKRKATPTTSCDPRPVSMAARAPVDVSPEMQEQRRAYYAAAMANQLGIVRTAESGEERSRHDKLFIASATAGNFAHWEIEPEERIKGRLLGAALECGLSDDASREIDNGFAKGASDPKELPPAMEVPNRNTNAPPTSGVKLVADVMSSDEFHKPQRIYSTGFAALDALIGGGLRERQCATVVGATGSGKTGFVLSIARHQARHGTPVLYCSTELECEEVASRLVAHELRRTPDDVLSLTIKPDAARSVLAPLPIYVLDLARTDGDSITAIEAAAEHVATLAGQMPLVIVDYMQELVSSDAERVRGNVTNAAKRLNRLSQDLGTAVLVVSAVSRAFMGQNRKNLKTITDARDLVSAGRESSGIEYAGAMVFFLDAEDHMAPDGTFRARLGVCKCRRGQPGAWAGLSFHGPSGAYTECPAALNAWDREVQQEGLDARIMDAVSGGMATKKTIRGRVKGCRAEKVDEAVDRMVEGGTLHWVERPGQDAAGRKITKRYLSMTPAAPSNANTTWDPVSGKHDAADMTTPRPSL